jgi:AraC-like DNA-binding protein
MPKVRNAVHPEAENEDRISHSVQWWSGSVQIATTTAPPEGDSRDTVFGKHAVMLALATRESRCVYRVDNSAPHFHRLRRGDFTFLPAGHRLYSEYGGRTQHMTVLLDSDALREDVLRGDLRFPNELPAVVLKRADRGTQGLLAALESECSNPQHADALYLSYLSHALLIHLTRARDAARDNRGTGPLTRFRIARLHEYIESNLANRLTIHELAAVIDVSPAHLARLFREATATPLHRYVMSRRLAKARDLLLRTDAPLSEIALATGFSSQSHLTSVFRRSTGHPPMQFRRAGGRR